MPTPATPATPSSNHKLALASLEQHLASDKSFLSCFARCLAALAQHDKNVSLAELAALTELARNTQYAALIGTQLLQTLEQGIDLERALADLLKVAPQVSEQERHAAFSMSGELLQLQGPQARPLARRLAQALKLNLPPHAYQALPAEAEPSSSSLGSSMGNLVDKLSSTTRQWVKGKERPDFMLEFAKSIGDSEMMQRVQAVKAGRLMQTELEQYLAQVLQRIEQDITQFRQQAALSPPSVPGNMLSAAHELKQQIEQRLAIISARMRFERTTFEEDIQDLVYDAGNAIENAISDRLHTDQWQDKDVWTSIGNSQFGKEAQRRIARAVQRREDILKLFKEELRLFQADMHIVHASILAQQHHTELAQLMPPLRIGTRVSNAVESAATLTLGAGTIAVAGTGAAMYLLGSAVVFPLVAPAAPFVAGALAAAGLVKWFSDSDKRKIAEIAHKRKAIEAVVKRQLQEAADSFNTQLDEVEHDFKQTAIALLTPIMLDAQAAQELHTLHQRVASKIIEQTEASMRQIGK